MARGWESKNVEDQQADASRTRTVGPPKTPEQIARIRDAVNPGLVVEGILRTMFDPRNNLANDVSSQLILHFGEQVYATVIPRNVRLAEAPSFGLPVMFYDKGSRGALAYLALADEIMRRDRPAERASA